jgi:hypothetical protein
MKDRMVRQMTELTNADLVFVEVTVSVPWVRMRVYSDVIGISFRVTLFMIYLF